MSSGGQQPLDSMAEVGAAGYGVEKGGCRFPDLGPDLLGVGSVGHDLQVEDVGHDTENKEVFGII